MRRDLETSGAVVVETDFPAVSNYEGDRPGAPTIRSRGLVTEQFLNREINDLSSRGGAAHRYTGFDDDIATYPDQVRRHPSAVLADIPELAEGVAGLEATRRVDLEEWMDSLGLDAVVFPAVADVGPADMDVNPLLRRPWLA